MGKSEHFRQQEDRQKQKAADKADRLKSAGLKVNPQAPRKGNKGP